MESLEIQSPWNDRLEEMAKFVVHLGFKPKDYWQLTMEERAAIISEWNRSNRKHG